MGWEWQEGSVSFQHSGESPHPMLSTPAPPQLPTLGGQVGGWMPALGTSLDFAG